MIFSPSTSVAFLFATNPIPTWTLAKPFTRDHAANLGLAILTLSERFPAGEISVEFFDGEAGVQRAFLLTALLASIAARQLING